MTRRGLRGAMVQECTRFHPTIRESGGKGILSMKEKWNARRKAFKGNQQQVFAMSSGLELSRGGVVVVVRD